MAEMGDNMGFDSRKAMDTTTAAAIATDDEHALTIAQAFRKYPKACFWAIAISLTIVMEGYDTILISSLIGYPSFKKQYGTYYADLDEYVISTPWQIGLGNAASCGSVIGLLINGAVTERYGHRLVIMAGLILMSGLIFIMFFATSIEVLTIGEVLVGIPWGMFGIMGSAYASEVCPLALRGFLTAFVNICWVLGQLIAAGVLEGLVDNTTKWAYKIPFAIQWLWPIPLFILAYMAPDSPWWLVRKGRVAEAEQSVLRLSSNSTLDEARLKVAMMVHTNSYEVALNTESSYWDCFKGTNLRRTEIACMILAAQTLSGEALAYSATYFFEQAGLPDADAYKLSFGSYALAFIATIVSWFLLGYCGRRTLLCTGLGLLALDLFVIGCLSYSTSTAAPWTQSALALVWLTLYSSLLGPESFCLAAEISATRLRAQTLSIARNFYNVVNIMTGVVEPYLINPTSADLKGKTAFVWFGTCTCTLVWALFRLPETRNLTYNELDVLFEQRVPAWKFSSRDIDGIATASQTLQEKGGHAVELLEEIQPRVSRTSL